MDEIMAKAMFATAERWLYNLSKWRAEIVVLQEQLNDYSGKVTVGYGQLTGTSGPGDGTFTRTTEVMESEDRLPILLAKEKMIEAAIDSLPDQQRMLVTFKYIKGWDNARLWQHMCISERVFYREREEAIRQIRDILSNDHRFMKEVENRAKRIAVKVGPNRSGSKMAVKWQ